VAQLLSPRSKIQKRFLLGVRNKMEAVIMWKWYRRKVSDRAESSRRFFRRLVLSPALTLQHVRFRKAVGRRDWLAARELMNRTAPLAIPHGDKRLLKDMAEAAGRLGEYEKSALWDQENARLTNAFSDSDWRAEDLQDATMVVRFMENPETGLGSGLEHVGLRGGGIGKGA
jgi:hypothetical protein